MMKFFAAVSILLSASYLASCQGGKSGGTGSNLAQVEIRDLPASISYETMDLRVSQGTAAPQLFSLSRNQRTLDQSFQPGAYHIEIDLRDSTGIKYSSTFCAAPLNASQDATLAAGPNLVKIFLCDPSTVVINPANVDISAILITQVPTDGTSHRGEITASAQEIYFSFQGVAGKRYSVRGVSTMQLDTVKTISKIVADQLVDIATDDDSGGNNNPLLYLTVTESATYIVKLKPYRAAAVGTVDLSVEVVP